MDRIKGIEQAEVNGGTWHKLRDTLSTGTADDFDVETAFLPDQVREKWNGRLFARATAAVRPQSADRENSCGRALFSSAFHAVLSKRFRS
jgi:hypothetical protein